MCEPGKTELLKFVDNFSDFALSLDKSISLITFIIPIVTKNSSDCGVAWEIFMRGIYLGA